jgi:hypothetical protein
MWLECVYSFLPIAMVQKEFQMPLEFRNEMSTLQLHPERAQNGWLVVQAFNLLFITRNRTEIHTTTADGVSFGSANYNIFALKTIPTKCVRLILISNTAN